MCERAAAIASGMPVCSCRAACNAGVSPGSAFLTSLGTRHCPTPRAVPGLPAHTHRFLTAFNFVLRAPMLFHTGTHVTLSPPERPHQVPIWICGHPTIHILLCSALYSQGRPFCKRSNCFPVATIYTYSGDCLQRAIPQRALSNSSSCRQAPGERTNAAPPNTSRPAAAPWHGRLCCWG